MPANTLSPTKAVAVAPYDAAPPPLQPISKHPASPPPIALPPYLIYGIPPTTSAVLLIPTCDAAETHHLFGKTRLPPQDSTSIQLCCAAPSISPTGEQLPGRASKETQHLVSGYSKALALHGGLHAKTSSAYPTAGDTELEASGAMSVHGWAATSPVDGTEKYAWPSASNYQHFRRRLRA